MGKGLTDIPGFEGRYKISRDGNVLSVNFNHAGDTRFLAPGLSGRGYLVVCLSKDGIECTHSVHSLVLLTYRGKRPGGLVARHLNGDRLDNRAGNLVWGTSKENAIDRRMHGRTAEGERHGMAKLTEAQVHQIRKEYIKGSSEAGGGGLAKKYGVCRRSIMNIIWGQKWRSV